MQKEIMIARRIAGSIRRLRLIDAMDARRKDFAFHVLARADAAHPCVKR
jgi:hypothetical protein